ncbi:MAG: hypothetical protein JWO06_1246 [Bacteroidota bacterium]|nr:hypothetical protein [Bacteroidota bacterium]
METNLTESVEAELPSWWDNYFWKIAKEYFKNKIFLFGFIIFAGYWFLPLLVGCICSVHTIGDTMKDIHEFGHLYLSDHTHLFFSLTVSAGGMLCLIILNKIPTSISILINEEVLTAPSETIKSLYLQERKNAHTLFLQLCSALLVIPTGFAFFKFFYLPKYSFWWGNSAHGYQGIYFMLIAMLMVYYGTRVLVLLSFNTKFLYDVLKLGIKPKIFHSDNSNGLSALGNIIILKWLLAICIILAILILLFFGYLNFENTIETKILVSICSLAIPIIAILPLLKSLREISKTQKERLKIFGKFLNEKLDSIQTLLIQGDIANVEDQVKNFNEMQQVFNTIAKMNVFPFNPRALAFVIFIYAFQIGLTIYQLVNHVA